MVWSHNILLHMLEIFFSIFLAISCVSPLIEDSNYAQPNGSYAFGAVISVECDRCRETMVDGVRGDQDTGTLTCTASGKWDKPIPSCQCEWAWFVITNYYIYQ